MRAQPGGTEAHRREAHSLGQPRQAHVLRGELDAVCVVVCYLYVAQRAGRSLNATGPVWEQQVTMTTPPLSRFRAKVLCATWQCPT